MNSSLHLQKIEGEQININDSLSADAKINAFIKPYKEHIDKQMDSVLAYSPRALSKKDTKYNTAIGNMMADAVMAYADPIFKGRTTFDIDAVLLNFGGIRSTLPQGNITMREAYNIMPFENRVIVLELSGKKVNELFDYLKQGTAHPINGLQLIINDDGAIEESRIHGKPVDTNETYFIATNDYLQNGGDHMDFFKNPVSMLDLDYKVRNILIDYFADTDTIAPIADDRFIKR
ncbi:5'-nucleotidase C-terminal domain-containing protein [Flavimarina sp. Hel_I_48]|uniref:5'-nucleotidase C-terminal domain-containing protein n=1 Tax=Flavimarina sp. Hel_I_48 TaxID=1392488 RepID=UPI001F134661|nr:5'-nucleotidase [Flavimarina sp. Hel_I_48]